LRYGIHRVEARHEIFELIQALYPSLTVAERRKLIGAVSEYQGRGPDTEPEILAWEHWQWLYALLIHEMDALKSEYPNLKEREYPDLHMWSSKAYFGFTTPWNVTELLSKQNTDWFEEIKQFKSDDTRDFNRWELIRSVQDASNEQPVWALTFCDYLKTISDWQNDLWPSLLSPFETWPRDDSVIARVIAILTSPEIYELHPRAVVKALIGHLKSEEFDFSSDVHQKANQVSYWTRLSMTID
jgi:hypothetical protein